MADAGSGKNIGKTLQKKVFRTREKVLQNLGKADKTTDDVFEQHVMYFNEQQTASLRLQKELKNYLTCVKEMSAASQSMYRTIKEVYEPEWTGFTEVTSAVEQLAVLWDDYVGKLSNELQTPLNAYIMQFPDMKAKISKRNRKLTDFDGARHNYESAAKKQDDLKTNKAKEEMTDAKQVYEILNEELNSEMPALYNSRVDFMSSHVHSLCSFEATFQHESAKLKDIMAGVSEKLCQEAASSGKPFAALPRFTEPVRTQASIASQFSREEKVCRLNNAPTSPTAVDEARTSSPKLQKPASLPPQYRRVESKEEERSIDLPMPKVNNGAVAEQRPVSVEKAPARVSHSSSSGLRLSSQGSVTNSDSSPRPTNAEIETPALSAAAVNGNHNYNNDTAIEAQVVHSLERVSVSQVPEERVLFRVLATHPYIGEDIDELTFEAGEVITVVPFDDPEEQDEGWLMGVKETTKQKGVFPENFTQRL